MEPLFIEAGEFTPEISFDSNSNIFEISGVSRPENVMGFYQPAFSWLQEYENEVLGEGLDYKYRVNSLKLIIKLSYFNSASSKAILQILDLIRKFHLKGVNVEIDFYYDEGDEQMREDGEDLSEAIEIPFNYIMIVE